MKNITRKTFLKTAQAATFLGVMSTCLPKTFATGNFTDELVATSDTQYIRVTPDGNAEVLSKSEFVSGAKVEAARREEAIKSIMSSRASEIAKGEELKKLQTSYNGYLSWYVKAYRTSLSTERYRLTGHYEWTTSPSTLGKDVFAVSYTNGLTHANNHNTAYSFQSKIYMLSGGKKLLAKNVNQTSTSNVVYDKGGASIIQDLATERPASGAGYVYKSENQMGSLSFNVEVASKASTGATVFATYYHRKNERNLAISVSIPIGGSVSISDESSYEQIGNNPTITFALNK